MSSLFDEKLVGAGNKNLDDSSAMERPPIENSGDTLTAPMETASTELLTGQHTPGPLKNTVQELVKFGVLEAERKPNLYQIALTQQEAINQIIEPFDLALKIDAVRGLAMLVVAQTFSGDEKEDEWSHPLVRRQRLTLEQSLLIAILRQMYVIHEQEKGIGAGGALVYLDDLMPNIQLYLGDLGSDAREQKRLRNLLDNLKGHGVVSDIDDKDQFLIRPMITHLADPNSLTNLLQHFRTRVQAPITLASSEDNE